MFKSLRRLPGRSVRSSASFPSVIVRSSVSEKHAQPSKFAIVGSGFSGLACLYHLLNEARHPLDITIYDSAGIGAGASGASAGLLHPFSPRGKLLWKGREGLEEALALVQAAEEAYDEDASPSHQRARLQDASPSSSSSAQDNEYKVAYRSGIVRPARSLKQCSDFEKARKLQDNVSKHGAKTEIDGWSTAVYRVLSPDEIQAAVPGFNKESIPESPTAAFHIPSALVLHPPTYLESLWRACLRLSTRTGSNVRMERSTVRSLEQLVVSGAEGPDAVVICSGAATGSIEEMRDLLPLFLVHGITYEARPEAQEGVYPAGAPSILGPHYLAVHGQDSITIGATKTWGVTPESALAEISLNEWDGRPWSGDHASSSSPRGPVVSPEEHQKMMEDVERLWPTIAKWRIERIRTGVRAVPPRTSSGSVPIGGLAGYFSASSDSNQPVFTPFHQALAGEDEETGPSIVELPPNSVPVWLATGLGARGLVYHGLLGRVTAQAALRSSEDPEAGLPREFLWWRSIGTPEKVREYLKGVDDAAKKGKESLGI